MNKSEYGNDSHRLNVLYICAVVVFLFCLPIFFRNPIFLHTMIMIYFYAYLAMSWNIVGGFAGQLSMGHAAYTAIGAYVSTCLLIKYGISPWFGMFIGAIIASLVSLIIGYPCFKLRGAYFALSTLAFAELLRVLITNTNEFLGFEIKGAAGLLLPIAGHSPKDFQFIDKTYYYYIILSFCVILTIVSFKITNSRLGYFLAALKEDQEAAASLGINTSTCKLTANVISAFFTALGGVFYAQYVLYISATSIGSLGLSLEMVFMSLIGGKGTLIGPILGSVFMTPLAELTRTYLGGSLMGIHLVIYGAVIMIVIKFLPNGIIVPMRAIYFKFVNA